MGSRSTEIEGLAGNAAWSLLGRRAWSALRGLETLYKVSALANTLIFLRKGVYRWESAKTKEAHNDRFAHSVLPRDIPGICHQFPYCPYFFYLHILSIRSLLERATGSRLVYQQAVMTRIISFEYLNRQLVWQVVLERARRPAHCPSCRGPFFPCLTISPPLSTNSGTF